MTIAIKKVYFACSIRGGREGADVYAHIVGHIKTRAKVLTEIFADGKLTSLGMDKPSRDIWDTDMAWISESDVVIAEVSNPSLGVGYEIATAMNLGKPVLALYREGDGRKLSAMIDGDPNVVVARYVTIEEAFTAINRFLDQY